MTPNPAGDVDVVVVSRIIMTCLEGSKVFCSGSDLTLHPVSVHDRGVKSCLTAVIIIH